MNIKAILWTYKPRKDGSCNIKLYASVDGKKKYFKTKLSVLPTDFDEARGVVKRSHPSYKLYNATIRSKIRELEDHLLAG
ncbi:MAG: site-specific integrase, partial [Saprospiraceae bacterium]|nr:site-specific integrase [Saprospiraceae bacterium]